MTKVVGPQVARSAARLFGRRIWIVLASLLALILSGPVPPAHAQTIGVDAGAIGISEGDGCSLVEAVINANNDAATHTECPSGSGADEIVMNGGEHNHTSSNGPHSALPAITSAITIEGHGAIIEMSAAGGGRVITVESSGNLTLNTVTIRGGIGGIDDIGGGIRINDGVLTVNQSTITDNMVTMTFGSGAGIGNVGGMVTINYSTITGNTGAYGSGIYNSGGGTVTLNHSTVSGNRANVLGGGIFNADTSELILNNSTISYNRGVIGAGGVFSFQDAEMTLNRTIVAGNVSGPEAGPGTGIGDEISNDGTATVNNYNVVGSIEGDGQDWDGLSPGPTDMDTSNLPRDEIVEPLAYNGGTTKTHALPDGSPALDHVPAGLSGSHDQRGVSRDYNGMGDSGAIEVHDRRTHCFTEEVRQLIFRFGSSSRQMFIDASDGNIGALECVTVEEMGPGVDHPAATPSLQTGNWWHISANVDSGFNLEVGFPFVGADGGTRACKFLGNSGGGWDCGTGADHSAFNDSVIRTGVNSFSDWTVGQNAGPTAVHLTTPQAARALPPGYLAWAALGLLVAAFTLTIWRRSVT